MTYSLTGIPAFVAVGSLTCCSEFFRRLPAAHLPDWSRIEISHVHQEEKLILPEVWDGIARIIAAKVPELGKSRWICRRKSAEEIKDYIIQAIAVLSSGLLR